jgi:DNA-binding MarR family transcriptional regulator
VRKRLKSAIARIKDFGASPDARSGVPVARVRQSELARYLGVSEETVSRALKKMYKKSPPSPPPKRSQ